MPGVLIVDDERVICQGLAAILARRFSNEIEIGIALGGGEALRKLRGGFPADILLLDLIMPDMDGISLLGALEREGDLMKRLQVIIISGSAEFSMAQRAMRYGVKEYLLKPVSAKDLNECVRRAIERLPRAAEGDARPRDIPSESGETIRKVRAFIREHLSEQLTLSAISEVACMTPAYFSVFFRQKTGERLFTYVNRERMERAEKLMREMPGAKLGEIARACGFEDEKYFSRVFRKVSGQSFQEFKRNQSPDGEA